MLSEGAMYPLVGSLVGELSGDRVPAIEGIPSKVAVDDLKALSAAAACFGPVGLFHVVGVTPEARTLEMCLQGTRPRESIDITRSMLQEMEKRLWTTQSGAADFIALGCPHFSWMEFEKLARTIEGKKVHGAVRFWIFTSRTVYAWIKDCGILRMLTKSGAKVFTDGCPLFYPKETWSFSNMMTNSAKLANLCYSQTGLAVAYGSIEECIESAVHGRICRRNLPWRMC